jgi:hypothetical protein
VEGGATVILRYHLADSRQVPAHAEMVEVTDDGAISGWRTVSTTGVGWFAGVLPEDELADLDSAVSAVDGQAPPAGLAAPGSPTETMELGESDPISVAHVVDSDPEAWVRLVAVARRLLERLTDFPRAAVGMSLPAADRARLEHLGTDPLELDLATIAVRATAWRGYYEPAGDWTGAVAGPERVEAGPGWTHDLDLGLEYEPSAEVTLHVSASFAIVAGDRSVPVRVSHAPPAPLPDE